MTGQQKQPQPAWATTFTTLLACYDENDQITAPPEEVLDVHVVADMALLELCAYDEDGSSYTVTRKARAYVDAKALLRALIAQMDLDMARLAIPAEMFR